MQRVTEKVIIVLFVVFVKPVFAESDIPLDISLIVSADSWKETEYRPDVSPYFRYRAIYHRPLNSEARPWLEVQKIHTRGMGSSIEVQWSKRIDVFSNDLTSKAYDEICGEDKPSTFDCEAKIGCCRIDDIRWDKLVLLYTIYTRNHGSKYVREFQCRADRLPYDDFTIVCKEEIKY